MKKKILLILLFTPVLIFSQAWEDPFFTALERKSLPKIKELVAQGADINKQDNSGMTALMYACKNNRYIEGIKMLLDYKAKTSLEDNTGRTALDYFDTNKYEFVRENPIRKRLKYN